MSKKVIHHLVGFLLVLLLQSSVALAEANIPQLRPATDLTDAAKQVCAAV